MADTPRVVWQGIHAPDYARDRPIPLRLVAYTHEGVPYVCLETLDEDKMGAPTWRTFQDIRVASEVKAIALHQLPTWQGADRG